jgi:hypothetical protein
MRILVRRRRFFLFFSATIFFLPGAVHGDCKGSRGSRGQTANFFIFPRIVPYFIHGEATYSLGSLRLHPAFRPQLEANVYVGAVRLNYLLIGTIKPFITK